MRASLFAAAAAAVIAGCASTAAPTTVQVPIAVPCIAADQVPQLDPLPTTEPWFQSADEFDRLRALLLDRLRLLRYYAKASAALKACAAD